MTDQELDELFYKHSYGPGDKYPLMVVREFRAAVSEAIDAETKRLVEALRPLAAIACECTNNDADKWPICDAMDGCSCHAWDHVNIGHAREAARLIAEYDALQMKARGEYGCRCSDCGHYWKTRDYPSTCPICGKTWR